MWPPPCSVQIHGPTGQELPYTDLLLIFIGSPGLSGDLHFGGRESGQKISFSSKHSSNFPVVSVYRNSGRGSKNASDTWNMSYCFPESSEISSSATWKSPSKLFLCFSRP